LERDVVGQSGLDAGDLRHLRYNGLAGNQRETAALRLQEVEG